ncbi:MAG: hypothetical protein HDQ96_15735 [Lachnospiraceae bacterium]|nr:hypothetical protein [Lachnospiraceae bacterium]
MEKKDLKEKTKEVRANGQIKFKPRMIIKIKHDKAVQTNGPLKRIPN